MNLPDPKIQQRSERKRACRNCGAELTYQPGTTEVTCSYCGYSEPILLKTNGFEELALYPYLQEMGGQKHSQEITILHCKNCGANQHIEENYKSMHCVYCGSPLIVQDAYREDWIVPGAILPFQIEQVRSFQIFKKWVSSLWWAPNALKRAALDPQFTKGLYLPFWTFDAQLTANYIGERGEYYYETQSYTDSNGKRKSRQVQKTRWYPASGTVNGFVDDTLIAASEQRQGRIPKEISQWDLTKLQSFNSGFLGGFVTEKYTIPLIKGHLAAKSEAEGIATRWAKQAIGGDTQRVNSISVQLKEETFKHILLPVYISAYQYKGKRYNFYINGENGRIAGKRPYSFWKIFLMVLLVLSVMGAIIYLVNNK